MLFRDFRATGQATKAQEGMRQAGPQLIQVAVGK